MKSLSLIGMSKNAGKTTVLNALLRHYAATDIILGLTSIGRDGEERDVVTHTAKPRIYVKKDTVFATAASLLPLCDVTREILMTTGVNTPMGEVVILRARSDGYVQLAGPSINEQIKQLCALLSAFGADTVLVDGAFARRTLASPAVTEHTILCSGASLGGNMQRVVDETRHIHDLLQTPTADAERLRLTDGLAALATVDADGVCAGLGQAALTDALAGDMLRRGVRDIAIIADDASKFLIGAETHSRLAMRNIKLLVRNGTRLLAVTVNPVSAYGHAFDAGAFRDALAAVIATPVVNVETDEGAALYDLLD